MVSNETYNLSIASQCVRTKALGLPPGAFCVSGRWCHVIPMPCDKCESCYWLREYRGSKSCNHEAPAIDSRGRDRICRSYRRRTDEDWAALVYGNGDVNPKC